MVTHFIVQSFNVLLLTVIDTSCSLKEDLASKFIRSELMNWLKWLLLSWFLATALVSTLRLKV